MYVIRGKIPAKSNSYRMGQSNFYKPKAVKDYEKSFYLQCPERDRMITGQFKMKVKVFFQSNRSDLDNALKVLLDCLQMTKTIKNDNNCMEIFAQKFVDKVDPRIEYELTPIEL